MTKEDTLKNLSQIYEAIATSEKEIKEAQEREKFYTEKNNFVVSRSYDIARRLGKLKGNEIGTAAGGKIIGYKSERTTKLITKPVEAEFDGRNVKLWLEEEKSGSPDYTIRSKGINIKAAKVEENSGSERTIFSARFHNKSTNWIGEKASIEDMDMALSILGYVEAKLSTAQGPLGE